MGRDGRDEGGVISNESRLTSGGSGARRKHEGGSDAPVVGWSRAGGAREAACQSEDAGRLVGRLIDVWPLTESGRSRERGIREGRDEALSEPFSKAVDSPPLLETKLWVRSRCRPNPWPTLLCAGRQCAYSGERLRSQLAAANVMLVTVVAVTKRFWTDLAASRWGTLTGT